LLPVSFRGLGPSGVYGLNRVQQFHQESTQNYNIIIEMSNMPLF